MERNDKRCLRQTFGSKFSDREILSNSKNVSNVAAKVIRMPTKAIFFTCSLTFATNWTICRAIHFLRLICSDERMKELVFISIHLPFRFRLHRKQTANLADRAVHRDERCVPIAREANTKFSRCLRYRIVQWLAIVCWWNRGINREIIQSDFRLDRFLCVHFFALSLSLFLSCEY